MVRTPIVVAAVATRTRIGPRHLAAFSRRAMRVMLGDRMRFCGVIVCDELGAAGAVASMLPAARAIASVAAGGDVITSAGSPP